VYPACHNRGRSLPGWRATCCAWRNEKVNTALPAREDTRHDLRKAGTIVVRIGFVGLGAMARNHLQRLQEIPQAQVVAGADLDAVRREEASPSYGLRGYEDYRQMLERVELQAVDICVSPFAHDGQEETVARRSLALFAEKPLSLDLAYAQRVAATIAAWGVINAVGYQFRYLDVVEEARRILVGAAIIARRGFYFAPLPPTPWWRRRELSGGQIIEQATHVLDLMRYLAGEAERVSAERHRGALAPSAWGS
jgi:predicted dehydrogenase